MRCGWGASEKASLLFLGDNATKEHMDTWECGSTGKDRKDRLKTRHGDRTQPDGETQGMGPAVMTVFGLILDDGRVIVEVSDGCVHREWWLTG